MAEKTEHAMVILIVDGKLRYVNERITRDHTETVEEYVERVAKRMTHILDGKPA